MPFSYIGIDKTKVNNFRFKNFGKEYLLTNEIGEYCFLTPKYLQFFISGKIDRLPASKAQELKNKSFIRSNSDFQRLPRKYASSNSFLFDGPSLHIIVVTLRCDHRCIYCQTSSRLKDEKGWDMDKKTARKVVDLILESPSKKLNVEFQGGEPLLNFGIIKFIVAYIKEKNKEYNKNIKFSLVSNFMFMDEEKLNYLIKNDFSLCTSLDGPETLHNKNRISMSGNSYANALKWIRIIQAKRKKGEYKFRINALTTITKLSLKYPTEIIDEFIKLNLDGIHLRPVMPFGTGNKNVWDKLSISNAEFMVFYKRAFDYILKLNKKGQNFYERTARIFLTKILNNLDPNYMDMRSPCGAGIGQLAYNFNGDVYTCDEARMISASLKDESFRLGNVMKTKFTELVDNGVVKAFCFASCLDNLPRCADCVYKPYCGVCPVYNYWVEGSLFSKTKVGNRCHMNYSILDYLFSKLETPAKKVFKQWVQQK